MLLFPWFPLWMVFDIRRWTWTQITFPSKPKGQSSILIKNSFIVCRLNFVSNSEMIYIYIFIFIHICRCWFAVNAVQHIHCLRMWQHAVKYHQKKLLTFLFVKYHQQNFQKDLLSNIINNRTFQRIFSQISPRGFFKEFVVKNYQKKFWKIFVDLLIRQGGRCERMFMNLAWIYFNFGLPNKKIWILFQFWLPGN